MDWSRMIRHLVTPPWLVTRAFPQSTLDAIEAAVNESENSHHGELRFAVEAGLDFGSLWQGETARERALEVFGALRVWDTEDNSGVLIYVQLVDHRIEIVADRGIARHVPQAEWEHICRRMEVRFKARDFERGVLDAIAEITALLALHFPAGAGNRDELPDVPVIL